MTLNVACWSTSYSEFLKSYIPEFERTTGAKVVYETPAFPIYNQRMDIELSTRAAAHDVINVTFIYSGRWVGAGWTTPLDDFVKDPAKTPADFDPGDFIPGTTAAFRDRQGRLHAIPWIADVHMAGCSRNDLFEQAGVKQPDTFDEMASVLKALKAKGGPTPFVVENHYGWTFIPYLQGFGGRVFAHAPDDLHPTLDSPEAVHAADFFCEMLRSYGPDGVLSYTYDQVLQGQKDGTINYSTSNETFLVQMAKPDTKVSKTCSLSMMPGGPAGRFPNVAAHGWGIPTGAANKEAAWAFITWAMSKPLLLRMFREHGYSSVTRASMIDQPEFRERSMINGVDVAQLYLDTLKLGGKGYTVYRTVPPYPPVDREIDIAIQTIVSKQMGAKEAMQRAQQNALRALQRAGVKL
ncbi:MAG TPA: extracellular solute-binding protein [Acetobacteraceae bacterium]|nr:extracellular solute-binding protein [Acetobacteraceae bacterium]